MPVSHSLTATGEAHTALSKSSRLSGVLMDGNDLLGDITNRDDAQGHQKCPSVVHPPSGPVT